MFQGDNITIYLCEEGARYLLFVADENGHEIYTSPIQQSLTFSFDMTFKTNGVVMDLITRKGDVNLTDNFEEIFYTSVNQMIGSNEEVSPLQLCLDFSAERTGLKVGIIVSSILLLLTNFSNIKSFTYVLSS